MKQIQYSTTSWHYKIWMSMLNSTVPPLQCERYQSVPPNNFCSYWRTIFTYYFLQVPFLLMFGFAFSLVLVFLPLMSIFLLIVDYSNFFNFDHEYKMGLVLAGIYATMLITAYFYERYNDEESFIGQYYDAYKNKYCPSIEFKENDK